MVNKFRMTDAPDGPQRATITFTREILEDESPDLSYLEPAVTHDEDLAEDENERADAARLAAYEAGEWHMCGVRARADISVPAGGGSFALFTLTSPGIWSIESDSGSDYFDEVYAEELEQLKVYMAAMGGAFAPELLASVKELRSVIDYTRHYEQDRMSAGQAKGLDEIFTRACAAITKAEG